MCVYMGVCRPGEGLGGQVSRVLGQSLVVHSQPSPFLSVGTPGHAGASVLGSRLCQAPKA